MKLQLINEKHKDLKIFERINDEAFPPSEHLSMEKIISLTQTTNTDLLGIYDDESPVGFIVILKNDECGYVYFLAIDKSIRSKGYGSKALHKLFELYPDIQIILDFEEINENAENIEQRKRRKDFYLRNNFHETGRYTFLQDEPFEVVCTKGELLTDSFKSLIKILHEQNPLFKDTLL